MIFMWGADFGGAWQAKPNAICEQPVEGCEPAIIQDGYGTIAIPIVVAAVMGTWGESPLPASLLSINECKYSTVYIFNFQCSIKSNLNPH